jgi:serine/threonine-protein kinase
MDTTPAQAADRVEDVFHRALAAPSAADRAAVLDRACGAAGDGAALRARVEALLAAHDAADGLLRLPAGAAAGGAGPGTQVGPYRLVEQIGEGGFAVVFRAEQLAPVRRAVALKLIKPGMDTRQVVARFEAERQALAMMEHEHVARVFDGGATDAGRPYFVMELVDGVPVTEYCDRHRLDVRRRLAVFAQACRAVEHAHQKGVIHRDLKPSNVLVATRDGRPHAKVIDFGIAKATAAAAGHLADRTLMTDARQLVGTPAYMSPEQADGSPDLDTRTDVYSLGVILYELLAGRPPFDPRDFGGRPLAEVQRVIRETDPPPPSTRLAATADDLPAVAARRATDPRRLGAQVRGELDWIVVRCLEKDRGRRYRSAGELADDVARHLADEAVTARPPSVGYRARKLLRRHRLAAGAAAAVAATVLAALGVCVHLLLRERDARDRAVEARAVAESARAAESSQRQRAQAHLARAREVAQLVRTLAGGDSRQAADAHVLRRHVLERIAGNLEALTADPADDARATAEVAEAYFTAATARREVNQPDDARRLCGAAIDRLRPLAERFADRLVYRQRLADYYFMLFEVCRDQGDVADATAAMREAMAHERASYERNRADPGDASHHAWLLTMAAAFLSTTGGTAEAVPLAAEGVAIQERLLAEHPADATRPLRASDARLELAACLQRAGRHDEALASFRRRSQLDRAHAARRPGDADAADRLARGLEEAATALIALDRLAEADAALREAGDAVREALASAPANIDLHVRALLVGRATGYVRWRQGRRAEAVEAYAAARRAGEWLGRSAPDAAAHAWMLPRLLVEAAEPAARDPHAAVGLARSSLERWPRMGGLWVALAAGLYQTGDAAGALAAIERAERSDAPPAGGTLYLKAVVERAAGRLDAARATFARAEASAARTRPEFWQSLYVVPARDLFGAAPATRPTTPAP